MFMEKAYMAQVSQHMSSYDILPVLEALCPGEIEGFLLMEVMTFLASLQDSVTNLVCKVICETFIDSTHTGC